jgi:ABC-type hemin transport system substrate-binding protein
VTGAPPRGGSRVGSRVVSLVPSATETLVALGVVPVACTRFCEQDGIPTVGGTKDPLVDDIVALAPDLVVVNDEENRIEDFDALRAAGLDVHSMSPRSVSDVGPAVAALARRIGASVPAPFTPGEWDARARRAIRPGRGRAAVLIWRRPWMAMRADTYGGSVLERLGWQAVPAVEDATDRYPELALDRLAGLAPNLVLLPDEPYPFRARHVDEVAEAVPAARVRLLDGRDLFWWGMRTPEALERLSAEDW